MSHSYNMIDSILSGNELRKYRTASFTTRAAIAGHALTSKEQDDPEFEVFLPLQYCLSYNNVKDSVSSYIFEPNGWHVSNHGRILSFRRRKEGSIISAYRNPERDHLQVVYVADRRHSLLIQRAVASVFIPCEGLHPKHMEVRQYNRDKYSVHRRNLYWANPGDKSQ